MNFQAILRNKLQKLNAAFDPTLKQLIPAHIITY